MAYDGDGVAAMACRCEGVFVAQTPSTRLAACGAPGAAMACRWVLSVRGSYAIDATRRDGVEGKKKDAGIEQESSPRSRARQILNWVDPRTCDARGPSA